MAMLRLCLFSKIVDNANQVLDSKFVITSANG